MSVTITFGLDLGAYAVYLSNEYVPQDMISNTAPFDLTQHPAMAIPCGMSDELPVSVMLIGRH